MEYIKQEIKNSLRIQQETQDTAVQKLLKVHRAENHHPSQGGSCPYNKNTVGLNLLI